MKVSELSVNELARALRDGTLLIRIGPFVARLRSNVETLAQDIALLYADFSLCPPDSFADFHVMVARESGIRRWVAPRVRFYFDGTPSFIPLPADQACAMLEWGLNWCVAAHSHQYLVIHAAVVERNNRAALLPAPPGSGKSTLCAALVLRGWRLLSDELALYHMETGLIHGMSRPINLKNNSIDVIRQFAPDAVMSAPVPDTAKGTVALLRPPRESVCRAYEAVDPTWIVLPQFTQGAQAELVPHERARTFMLIAEQSFNYDVQGPRGFEAVGRLVDRSACYRLTYGKLQDARQIFEELLTAQPL